MDYLLKSAGKGDVSRPGTATALITVYAILLLLVAIAYFRLLYTVARNPGFVPRGPRWHADKKSRTKSGKDAAKGTKPSKVAGETGIGHIEQGNDRDGGSAYPDGPPTQEDMDDQPNSSNIQEFYAKDVFSCEGDGKPIWCSTCSNFKPDRAHHCREVGRCVRKMDHFCPW